LYQLSITNAETDRHFTSKRILKILSRFTSSTLKVKTYRATPLLKIILQHKQQLYFLR